MTIPRMTCAAGAAVLFGSVQASAVTVTVLDSTADGPASTVVSFGKGFDGTVPMGATFDAPTPLTVGTVSFVGKSPFDETALENTQTYFSIGQPVAGPGFVSPITLGFDALQSTLTVLWGSIDTYNSIAFNDAGGGVIDTVTGTDVAILLGLDPTQSPDQFMHTALVRFDIETTEPLFESVTFISTDRAFEFALAKPPVIPVPATALMLVAALAALPLIRRKG